MSHLLVYCKNKSTKNRTWKGRERAKTVFWLSISCLVWDLLTSLQHYSSLDPDISVSVFVLGNFRIWSAGSENPTTDRTALSQKTVSIRELFWATENEIHFDYKTWQCKQQIYKSKANWVICSFHAFCSF